MPPTFEEIREQERERLKRARYRELHNKRRLLRQSLADLAAKDNVIAARLKGGIRGDYARLQEARQVNAELRAKVLREKHEVENQISELFAEFQDKGIEPNTDRRKPISALGRRRICIERISATGLLERIGELFSRWGADGVQFTEAEAAVITELRGELRALERAGEE